VIGVHARVTFRSEEFVLAADPSRPLSTTFAVRACIGVAACAALMGCSTTSPDVVSRQDAQRMSTVLDGIVLSTRPLVVEGTQSGVGAAAGSVVGAVAGSSVGGWREGAVVGVIGAVVGGVVGNAIERQTTREDAIEILVQLPSGERRAIVQAQAGETFRSGDPVIIVTTGSKVRVTRAPAATTVPAAPSTGTRG
jgi:outer membrane lipoprotein SlyB